jgi:uncharacterized UPF0160 family protein
MTKSKKGKSKTIKNNTSNDLDIILKEAEHITLDNLDFNKTFKEQGKILCDIKNMLSKSKNNKNNRNNQNKSFACNPIISSKLNNAKFNEIYQRYKKQNNLLNMKISSRKKTSKNINLNLSKSKILSKMSSLKSSSSKRKKTTKYKINTRYPIVIIKKRTPRKNVIYLNK